MKKCTKCQVNKEEIMFYKRAASADGLMPLCKVCHSQRSKDRYVKNPDKVKAKSREYANNNKEKITERRKKYHEKNKDKILQKHKEYYVNNKEKFKYVSTPERREKRRVYSAKIRPKRRPYMLEYYQANKERLNEQKKQYKKENKAIVNASNARRRAKKLNATIGDFKESIDLIYKTVEGVSHIYDVDHIVPLINKDVCGLHVPWNLQIITSMENAQKGNKFDGTRDNEGWKTMSQLSHPLQHV